MSGSQMLKPKTRSGVSAAASEEGHNKGLKMSGSQILNPKNRSNFKAVAPDDGENEDVKTSKMSFKRSEMLPDFSTMSFYPYNEEVDGEGQEEEEGEGETSNRLSGETSALDLADGEEELYGDIEIEEYSPSNIFKERGYEKLKKLFEEVLGDIDDAKKYGVPLEEVKELFYIAWASVEQSRNNEQDLVKADRELSVVLAEKIAMVRILIKIAEEDPIIAERLGRRLESAWSLVDIGEAEERRNTHKIETLREEIFTLNRNISAAANLEGLDQVNDLMKLKKKLTVERDVLFKESGQLRSSVSILKEKRAQQAERKIAFQELIRYSIDEAATQKAAIARETARKDAIFIGIEEATKVLESKDEELLQMRNKVLNGQQKIEDLDRNIRDQKIANEAALREAELSNSRIDKLRQDYEAQSQLIERMNMESLTRSADLKTLEDDVNVIKLESHRTSRQRALNTKKCNILETSLANLETEKESLKEKTAILEKELDIAQKKLEENRKRVDELQKERTLVNRNLRRAVSVTEEHENQAKIHALAVANLQSEMQAFDREVKNQLKAIDQIDAEKDGYAREATKLASYAALGMEEVKKVSAHVFEVRKRLGEVQDTFKKAQQLYEMAMNDKLSSDKMLRELEINRLGAEVKVKHRIFELNMLNYQLYDHEKIYTIEMDQHDRVVRQCKFFTDEKARLKRMAIDMKQQVEALEVERSNLGCMIAEAEGEISKQKYYKNSAASRRDNYQRKLMIKDNELKDIAEKWRTLHSQVRIGAYHYRNIMKEIYEKRQDLVNLRRIQFEYKSNVNHVTELRQEIAILEMAISKEICMVNDLNDQLTRPKNVHRWRSLEALNPEAYDKVRKINLVTNRLVERNGEIEKNTEQMKGKEEIAIEIKRLLQRSPGLETPEEREFLEHLVAAKKKQLAILKKELQTAEGQTMYYRREITKINGVYKQIQHQYFLVKSNKIQGFTMFGSTSQQLSIGEDDQNEEQALYENRELPTIEEDEEIEEIFEENDQAEIMSNEIEGEGADLLPSYIPVPTVNE